MYDCFLFIYFFYQGFERGFVIMEFENSIRPRTHIRKWIHTNLLTNFYGKTVYHTINQINTFRKIVNLNCNKVLFFNNFFFQTYTGSILVAVNPYKMYDMYGLDMVKKYEGQILGTLPPWVHFTIKSNRSNSFVLVYTVFCESKMKTKFLYAKFR